MARRPGGPWGADQLFWTTWTPVGFDQLFVDPPKTPLGAFWRQWLERTAQFIEEAPNGGLDPSCDLVIGIRGARLELRTLHMSGGRLELLRAFQWATASRSAHRAWSGSTACGGLHQPGFPARCVGGQVREDTYRPTMVELVVSPLRGLAG